MADKILKSLTFLGSEDVYVIEPGIGKKTEYGGEIFNDYENNKAISVNTHAEGQGTHSGIKGFRIHESFPEAMKIIIDDGDLGEKAAEVYPEGAYIQFDASQHYYNRLKIAKKYVNTDTKQSVFELEDSMPNNTAVDLSLDTDAPDENFVWVVDENHGEVYTMAYGSHAEGEETKAMGRAAHAEGRLAQAIGNYAHAEGRKTTANYCAHAEGFTTNASGHYSHAEGANTISSGEVSHAENKDTQAVGHYSHAEGTKTIASGISSHAEGINTTANGSYSHAEGSYTAASGVYSHAEGYLSIAAGTASHAEGSHEKTLDNDGNYRYGAFGDYSHVEGNNCLAKANSSHAEGKRTKALGIYSHAEGVDTTASGQSSHAEGKLTQAIKDFSHAEGLETKSNYGAHAEGYNTNASGNYSHAEGESSVASGGSSHAEGKETKASGSYAHAEGSKSEASGPSAHAEGSGSKATNNSAHAEGSGTIASGWTSHAEGYQTIASSNHSHVQGRYNIPDYEIDNEGNVVKDENGNPKAGNKYAHIVGGGNTDSSRKNIHTLDWKGNPMFAGDHITLGNVQICYSNGSLAIKTRENGIWGPLEYVNPSMMPGVEYRTTERWCGKPVYTKVIQFGEVQDGGMMIDTGLFSENYAIIDSRLLISYEREYILCTASRSEVENGIHYGYYDVRAEKGGNWKIKLYNDNGNQFDGGYVQIWYAAWDGIPDAY